MNRPLAVLALIILPQFAAAQETEHPVVRHPVVGRPAIAEIDTPPVRSGEKECLEFLVVLPYQRGGSRVRIRIFDSRGRLMGTAVKTQEDGTHIIYRWDKLGRLPDGQYVAKLEAQGHRSSLRFTLARPIARE